MTPEERCERVRMALAEAGWTEDGATFWDGLGVNVWTEAGPAPWVPVEAAWRACAVVGEPIACWPCYDARPARTCDHDPMTSPWPEVVR